VPNSTGTRGPTASETSREVARPTAPIGYGRWQVFGLVGSHRLSQAAGPTGRRFPGASPSADDGFRSHLPLRGSSGFAPDSLLPPPTGTARRNQPRSGAYLVAS
jgi:hypothetical protein